LLQNDRSCSLRYRQQIGSLPAPVGAAMIVALLAMMAFDLYARGTRRQTACCCQLTSGPAMIAWRVGMASAWFDRFCSCRTAMGIENVHFHGIACTFLSPQIIVGVCEWRTRQPDSQVRQAGSFPTIAPCGLGYLPLFVDQLFGRPRRATSSRYISQRARRFHQGPDGLAIAGEYMVGGKPFLGLRGRYIVRLGWKFLAASIWPLAICIVLVAESAPSLGRVVAACYLITCRGAAIRPCRAFHYRPGSFYLSRKWSALENAHSLWSESVKGRPS